MKKFLKAQEINLPRENHAKSPVYEHNGKYYIKANKPNTSSYNPLMFNGEEYSEVRCICDKNGGFWYLA